MAKKSKTPPPPRSKGPQRQPGPNDTARRQRLLLYGAGVAGIVVLAVVVITIALAGGGNGSAAGDDKVASTMTAAGCSFRSYPVTMKTSDHSDVPTLTTSMKGKWKSFPPAGGPHYGQWAVWDFYTEAVNPRMVVHNEEHGGVVLWWGPDTPAATVDDLNAFYSDDPVSMIGTPLEGFGSKIGITAWTGDPSRYFRDGYYGIGHVATCPQWDDKTKAAFTAFRDAYRGKGPEGVSMNQNQPGSS